MFHIVENRRLYFLLSAIVIIPGLIAIIYSMATTGLPFKVAIDFTGGSLWEITLSQAVQPGEVRQIFVTNGEPDTQVTNIGSDGKTVANGSWQRSFSKCTRS